MNRGAIVIVCIRYFIHGKPLWWRIKRASLDYNNCVICQFKTWLELLIGNCIPPHRSVCPHPTKQLNRERNRCDLIRVSRWCVENKRGEVELFALIMHNASGDIKTLECRFRSRKTDEGLLLLASLSHVLGCVYLT